MLFYILRHGETDMNKKGVMQGRMDVPLNHNGRELAVLTGRAMAGIRFDKCFSSPLVRAKETAETVLRESGNDVPVMIDERITEIDFGVFDGKCFSEAGEQAHVFFTKPFEFTGFPGGERVREVCDRTQAFLKEQIAKDDGGTYLTSMHGCAMRAMVNFLLEDPADYWLGRAPYNCSVTVVRAEGGKASMVETDKVFYDKSLIVDYYRSWD